MITRFTGPDSKKYILEALLNQWIVKNDLVLASALADLVEVIEVSKGKSIIRQGDSDRDMFFIFTGELVVEIEGREQARRRPGQQVGEMALIDVTAPRSATVSALQDSIVAKISEPSFSALAETHSVLWRRLALDLAERLRERSRKIKPKNESARIFIGSSTESLSIARGIQDGLSFDKCVPQVWTDGVFSASGIPLDDLKSAVESSDFAILVLGPDDKIYSRNSSSEAPRDNVVFELGLFLGSLPRNRVFMVKLRGQELKLPSDLLGVTPIEYADGKIEDLPSRLGPACNQIRKAISNLGPV